MRKKHSTGKILALALIAPALTCLIILLVICSRLGVFDGRYTAVREYAALLDKIDEVYIGQYETDNVAAAAMRAAVDALGDKWSYYLTPREYADFLDNVNNRYAGIGVGVVADAEFGGMRVTFVYKDSAAEAAGIVAGDIIIGVDGEDITELSLEEMKAALSRELGDTVELTVLRDGGIVETLEAVYSYVYIDPVSYGMLADEVGYISLSDFDRGAAQGFISAHEELAGQGAAAYIYDVRGNGGGRLAELTEILDYLLPEGDIFVAVDKSGNEEITRSGQSSVDFPAVVLVDRYSFSAAEYFAAMLKEYGRAVLVGEQTTGKNRVQTTYELPGGGALHISSGQYLTKNRVSLYDTGGVTPDYQVEMTDEEFSLFYSDLLDYNADPQLQQALSLLRR